MTAAASNADSIVWYMGTTRKGTGTSYVVSSASMSDSGTYKVIAYSKSGCKNDTSAAFDATIIKAPVILTQPAATAQVCNGSSFSTLNVVAQNATAYQWKQGTTNKGGSAASIFINPFGVADTGSYTVIVSGNAPCASITSTISNVSLVDSAKITTQPATLTDVCLGGKLKLSVVANGVIGYQWYKGATLLVGETKDSFVIASVSALSAGSYRVQAIAFSGCINAMSNNAIVRVNNPVVFVTQPSASTICEGATISLSTVVSGYPSPTYVWKKNGVTITAPNSPNYTKSNATLLDSGLYTVDVTGSTSCPTISSNSAKISINPSPTIPVISGISPLCEGSTMTLSATATNQTGWIWKKGTTVIATTNTYTKTATPADSGNYTVTALAKTGCADVTSSVFNQVIVSPTVITAQPQSVDVVTGTSFTLSVSASQAASFQWKKNGVDIPGATSSSYTVLSFDSLAHAGSYTVVVTSISPCATVLTSTGALVTKAACPSIAKQPNDTSVCIGNAFTLSASALNYPKYQWFHNGQLLPGDTFAYLTRLHPTAADAGSYYVQITSKINSVCSALNSLTAQVALIPAPSIQLQPMPNALCAPTSYTVKVRAQNTVSYQWYRNNLAIPGATDSTYLVDLTTTANEGNYYVLLTGNAGCASTTSLTVPIRKRIASNLVKLADSTRLDLVEQCTEGIWTYYATAAKPDEFLLAVNKGLNTFTLAPDVILTNGIKDVVKVVSGVTHGVIFGKRYFNIDVLNGTFSAPYDVRFFYSVQDSLEVTNAYAARKSAALPANFSNPSNGLMTWILSTSAPFTSVFLNNVSYPLFFTNVLVQNKTYGTLNGVPYVDLIGARSSNGGGTNYMEYTIQNPVSIAKDPTAQLGLALYPVPVTAGLLTIELTSTQHRAITMTVLDAQGRAIHQQDLPHTLDHTRHTLEVSGYARGAYHILLDDGVEQTVGHFMIAQ
jgi:hypothetical protein